MTTTFTPTLANRALPLVRRIVRDILEIGGEYREEEATSGGRDSMRLKELRRELEGYIEELEAIGCSYRAGDLEHGLVDFPAVIDDKSVFLCWRSDEEEVAFYHEVDAGFAGRTPIPAELLLDDEPQEADGSEGEEPLPKEPLGSERD